MAGKEGCRCRMKVCCVLGVILCLSVFSSLKCLALTANKVEFEFHPGFYRVVFEYTIPELKELREGMIELKSKKKAEKIYWKLLRGADFYLGEPGQIIFINPKKEPDPW